jgi:hypothetical protein
MSEQSSTPNLGSWENLYQGLLGSGKSFEPFFRVTPITGANPCLKPTPGVIFVNVFDATSGLPPVPHPPPLPQPHDGGWRDAMDARALFLSGIGLKQVAANMPDGQALRDAADQAITDWEDDYCGTRPRPIPTLALAISQAACASTLQVGDLQTAIQQEASRIARKAFAPASQPGAAAGGDTRSPSGPLDAGA